MIIFVILAGIIGAIVLALTVFVLIYLFAFQPHMVKGEAMLPTYPNNAYVITDKLSYRSGQPQRGDIIVFKAPANPEFDYIKRIIGLPGEKLMIQNGVVYINSNPIKENYLPENSLTLLYKDRFIKEGETMVIPQDNYFVLGDNRKKSADSRLWGFVPKEDIIGKVTFCYANCK
ncbi:signal peptidase I [Candidatus Gottesmanbacteria bacterium]|nr:signal peptidase I [Candidatus Gottesmanbacteria bacterium]